MSELIDLIVAHASIWLPALTSVFVTVGNFITNSRETKKVIKQSVDDAKNAIQEFKADDTIKKLYAKLDDVVSENAELKEQLDILIDEIKHIKNYRENSK